MHKILWPTKKCRVKKWVGGLEIIMNMKKLENIFRYCTS